MSGEKTFFRSRRRGGKSDLINMVKAERVKKRAMKKANKNKKYKVLSPRGPF
jgi:hypothetical protein